MHKVDLQALRDTVVAEYRDFPNPTNDPVVAFESRAAEVIGDLFVFATRENNERRTGVPVQIQGFVAILSMMIDQIADHGVEPDYAETVRRSALASFARYLSPQGKVGAGVLPIPTKDVGDA